MHHIFTTVEHTVTFLVSDWNDRGFGVDGWGRSGWCCGRSGRFCWAGKVYIAVDSRRGEGNKAWCVPAGDAADPVLVLRHSGVNSGSHRLSATSTKTHDSTLDPDLTHSCYQRSSWVSLQREIDDSCWQIYFTTFLIFVWLKNIDVDWLLMFSQVSLEVGSKEK